ncbi:MAG: antitoxin AF2212-like protein [Candidatus Nezhaarchaeales archaeon]
MYTNAGSEGEEVIVRVERLEERRVLRELRGVLGSASKELLDKFMLEAYL